MAIDDGSELEDLMFCSTVVLFGNDVEEPKPKKRRFWVRNIFKSCHRHRQCHSFVRNMDRESLFSKCF